MPPTRPGACFYGFHGSLLCSSGCKHSFHDWHCHVFVGGTGALVDMKSSKMVLVDALFPLQLHGLVALGHRYTKPCSLSLLSLLSCVDISAKVSKALIHAILANAKPQFIYVSQSMHAHE